jgi:hypothetical protein
MQMSLAQWKVPALISVGLICFVCGLGAGAVGNEALGNLVKKWREQPAGGGGDSTGGSGKGKMEPTGGMGGMAMGRPSPKSQLTILVVKLDQVTAKKLTINLSEEKRAKLRAQLEGLDKKEMLSDADANKRMEAILEIVKEYRPTLEAAGYRWPGGGGGGGGMQQQNNAPNPFTTEQNAKHLKSLQEQVAKGAKEKGA